MGRVVIRILKTMVNTGKKIKTIIAGMVLLAAGGSVVASPNYEEYGARVQVCKDFADTADIYWRTAKMGRTEPTDENDNWLEPIRAHVSSEMFNHTSDYPDRDSAARAGALYCMDHIVSLARNHNAGQD